MKTIKNLVLLITMVVGFTFYSCEPVEQEEPDTLYVKFVNEADSEFTITAIELIARGPAGQYGDPIGDWSDNIIKSGESIPPGGHLFFTLEIPNLEWSQFRIGVDDGTGNTLMLHDQTDNYDVGQMSITHWGGDDRTVGVTVVRSEYSDLIVVTGYSDGVGIR